MLTRETIRKVKKKPLPPELKYEPPYKRQKDKGIIHGKWLEMFKWIPKVVGHGVEDSELKKAPS